MLSGLSTEGHFLPPPHTMTFLPMDMSLSKLMACIFRITLPTIDVITTTLHFSVRISCKSRKILSKT